MIKINDYATKNHLNEWEIKDLFYSDKYSLCLNSGLDLLFYVFDAIQTCYFYASKSSQVPSLFINNLPNDTDLLNSIKTIASGSLVEINIFVLDNDALLDVEYLEELEYECNQKYNHIKINNVVPDWSKYIAEDSAVLFLDKNSIDKYENIINNTQLCLCDDDNIINLTTQTIQDNKTEMQKHNKISIIIPSIHSQNIEEINNIAKDLKENYGVEYVEVVATHCLLKNKLDIDPFYYYGYMDKGCQMDKNINKIITTDSTAILKVQKSERLEVVDVLMFFK